MARSAVFEQYFRDTVDFLNSIGADFFIHGSTLLGKVRDNCLLQREGVMHDRELNFGMLALDYTDKICSEIKNHNKYFNTISAELPKILTFFSNFSISPTPGVDNYAPPFNPWTLPGFSLIALYWEGKTKAIEYMGSDIALVWDKEIIFNKKKWETVELLGKKVKTPYKKEKWLSDYFGNDYMTEKTKWHYSQDSINKESFIQLVKGGELCL